MANLVFSLHHYVERHHRLKADDQQHRSVYMILAILLMMAAFFAVFAVLNLTLLAKYQLHGGLPWPAILLFSHLACLAVLFDFHRNGNVPRAAMSTVLLCSGVLIIYIWLHGRNYGAPMFYFAIPALAFYLLGTRKGAVVSILILLMVLVADEFTLSTQPADDDTSLLVLDFIIVGTLLTLLTYLYESSRQFAITAAEVKNSELQFANQRLAALSASDGLTGIANRRHFDEIAAVEWARSARSGKPLALLFLDIDQFKAYNDTYGHLAGDEALKQVANVLRENARRPGDLAARFGGEEYVVIAAETTADAALAIAESIRAGVEALGLLHQHSSHGLLTVSIGVAVNTAGTPANLEALLRMADTAIYTAKNAGRNRVAMAESRPASP